MTKHRGKQRATEITLYEWLGEVEGIQGAAPSEPAVVDAIYTSAPTLGPNFGTRAARYAFAHTAFAARLQDEEDDFRPPILVHNADLLDEARRTGTGAIVVISHEGFFTAAPLAIAQLKIPCAFIFEQISPQLLALYQRCGVHCIQVSPPTNLVLADGRTLRLPGSDPLAEIQKALLSGGIAALWGDTYRPRGVPASLLGISVKVISHYALLAVRRDAPAFYLRQWTDEAGVHLELVPMEPQGRSARERANSLVEIFVSLLDGDLRRRPEQYLYGSYSIFSFGLKLLATGAHPPPETAPKDYVRTWPRRSE